MVMLMYADAVQHCDRVLVFTEKLPGDPKQQFGTGDKPVSGWGTLQDMFKLIWDHRDFWKPGDADQVAQERTLNDVIDALKPADGKRTGLKLLQDRDLLARAVVHFEKALGYGQDRNHEEGVTQVRHE